MISYVFLYLFSICKTTQFWYCERRSSFVSCLRFAKTSVFLDGCVLSEFDFPVLILNIFITDSHFPEILIITDPHFQESAEVQCVWAVAKHYRAKHFMRSASTCGGRTWISQKSEMQRLLCQAAGSS